MNRGLHRALGPLGALASLLIGTLVARGAPPASAAAVYRALLPAVLRSAAPATPSPGATPTATLTPAAPASPTATPTATATATPTATATATATATPRLFFSDDFAHSTTGWTNGSTAYSTRGYYEGEYRIVLSVPSRMTTGRPPCLGRDVRIEVDARFGTTTYGTYGITFGTTDNPSAYYYFMVNAYQQFCLYQVVLGQFTELVPLTPGASLKAALNVNRLAVRRYGEHIWLYANGVELAHVVDSTPLNGTIMGLTATSDSEVPVEVRWDNFAVYEAEPLATDE